MSQPKERDPLDLLFLGSGNAFGSEGRAFSSLLLNGRYLFDCGPTLLPQLRKAGLDSDTIDAVFISHFHGDHYFGLPFLFLDAWRSDRRKPLTLVGPHGLEQRAERLLEMAFPGLPSKVGFPCLYVEVADGMKGEAAGLKFLASEVVHVPGLTSFAFRLHAGGRTLVYSGDTTLCSGLLRLVPGADALVLECSCAGEAVHLTLKDVREVARQADPGARIIVTHLDGHAGNLEGLLVAQDLARFRL